MVVLGAPSPATTGASCLVKQRASSGAWVGAAAWIGTGGLKGGTKKQDKAPACRYAGTGAGKKVNGEKKNWHEGVDSRAEWQERVRNLTLAVRLGVAHI